MSKIVKAQTRGKFIEIQTKTSQRHFGISIFTIR